MLLTADNHPSNHTAWQEKAKRFGFTVKDVPVPNPHPGAEHYVEAFTQGDHAADEGDRVHAPHQHGRRPLPGEGALPLARERGILSLVDGAQTFGLMDVDLERHAARLLQRQRAQVAVRPEGERRPLHQQGVAVEDLAEHLQRLSRARSASRGRSRGSASATSRR